MKYITICLFCLFIGLWSWAKADEVETTTMANYYTISAFTPQPFKHFTCECPSGPMTLSITKEWVSQHSPAEIAMFFSMASFITNSQVMADYSEICCAVMQKLTPPQEEPTK